MFKISELPKGRKSPTEYSKPAWKIGKWADESFVETGDYEDESHDGHDHNVEESETMSYVAWLLFGRTFTVF